MKIFCRAVIAAMALLCIGQAAVLSAQSREPAQPMRDVPAIGLDGMVATDMRQLQVPCCKCLDGGRTTVLLNTGTAPWYLRSPGNPGFVPATPVPLRGG